MRAQSKMLRSCMLYKIFKGISQNYIDKLSRSAGVQLNNCNIALTLLLTCKCV